MGVNIWVNRKQMYLDIYVQGQRRREKLGGLIITGDKATDKETMRLAEIAKAKRVQQVFPKSGDLQIQLPQNNHFICISKKTMTKQKNHDEKLPTAP